MDEKYTKLFDVDNNKIIEEPKLDKESHPEKKAKPKEKIKPAKVVAEVCLFIAFATLYCVAMYIYLAMENFTAAVLILVAVSAADCFLTHKLKMPKFLFPLSVLLMLPLSAATYLIINMYAFLNTIFFFLCAVAIRLFAAGINAAIFKRFKALPVFLVFAVIFVGCATMINRSGDEIQKHISNYFENLSDRTNDSWDAINQLLVKPKSWQKIVKSGEFFLGEKTVERDGTYLQQWGTYPYIDGSTVCVPMALEFARQFLDIGDEGKEFCTFSTTHSAYEFLINYKEELASPFIGYYGNNGDYIVMEQEKKIDLLLATEPSDEELEMAKEAGVTLIKKPICYDAFVFITHKDNPVNSLTVEQIRDIYSGKITNWKQVGGNDEKIVSYQREKNSGSQTAMENLVMKGAPMLSPKTIKVIEGMGQLVDAVAEYKNAEYSIGYTYKYYVDNLYKNDKIKTIAIDSVEPTDENIRSGKYPFSTNYYAVFRKGEEKKTGGKFTDWILSPEGQKCVKQAGYIPMK